MLNVLKLRKSRASSVLRERFASVYNDNLWMDGESRSGPGSRRDSPSVLASFEALERAVREYNVQSIDDIPCGDFNWMPLALETLPKLRYRGFDVVKQLVRDNKAKHTNYKFDELDITTEKPPKADLIFCKDLLNHLPDMDVKRAIENMVASGSTYLIASNNPGFENKPLPNLADGSRYLDITAPPFSFNPPEWTVMGYLGFWRLDAIGRCHF